MSRLLLFAAALSALIGCQEYELSSNLDPLATGDGLADPPDGQVPDGVPTGGISGRICAPDTVTWVAGALVWVKHDYGRSETLTDGDGWFLLEGLPVGVHTVHVEKGSFSTTFMMEVFADDVTELAYSECIEQGDTKIAVVTGIYDDIGSLIDGLNITYDPIDGIGTQTYVDFLRDPDWLAEYDVIFFNCGMGFDWMDHQAEVADNLAAYVEDGGSVYASDWAYYLVEATWPAQQEFHGNDAVVGEAFVGLASEVEAQVYDPTMAALLGSDTAVLNYDLDAWVGMESARGEVLLEGEYAYTEGFFSVDSRTAPLAYRMTDGGGTVLYTTFHNERQTTVDMARILEEIILSL